VTAHLEINSQEKFSPWTATLHRRGGLAGVLATFLLLYLLLVLLGYLCKETGNELTLLWPAAGLLFSALWLSPLRLWPVYLLMQFAVEMAVGPLFQEPFRPFTALAFISANSLDAIVGALIARALIRNRTAVHVRQVLQFAVATWIGSAVSAALGAWLEMRYSNLGYWHLLQLWWAGNWLGTLTITPVVFAWAVPLRKLHPSLRLRSIHELLLFSVLIIVATVWIFTTRSGKASSVFQLPVVLAVIIVAASFRLPPRWSAMLAAASVLIAAVMAARYAGPFEVANPFLRVLQLQSFLTALMGISFLLTTALAEMRITMERLTDSEERYRSLVELSTEAVWRIELEEPMDASMTYPEQLQWLRAHAWIAECNSAYQQMDDYSREATQKRWRTELPWIDAYERQLQQAAKQHYSIDSMRFNAVRSGQARAYLASFSGVVSNGTLLRIWGVARDVTELVELNAQLQIEQSRLKTYARQIVSAEEMARRATAVDLHDGIGQVLVGMGMMLDVARDQATDPVRHLIDESRLRLREVQETTRDLIADLSPPGLYDLGLSPALQWLSDTLRNNDNLNVDLDVELQENLVPMTVRVLVFKLVRELLRNVIKHAGVGAASVLVRGDHEEVRVTVSDTGRGFDWQKSLSSSRTGGFGLLSVAGRIDEAGGELNVYAAPGRGARFEISIPVQAPSSADAMLDPHRSTAWP
jgi:signal transduction histidine kinase